MDILVLCTILTTFILYFWPSNIKNLHFLLFILIGLTYFNMAVEDFISQIVDMRAWSILFLLMQLYNYFSFRFNFEFFIGTFIFCFLFSCSWQIEANSQTKNKESKRPSFLHIEIGFLPSIGISLAIWYLFENKIPIPDLDMHEIYLNIFTSPFVIILLILACYFIYFREKKRYIAEKKHKLVSYRMGGGDVWVCGIWFGFLGFAKFILIFFIALCIQFLLSSICYFILKILSKEKEGIKWSRKMRLRGKKLWG